MKDKIFLTNRQKQYNRIAVILDREIDTVYMTPTDPRYVGARMGHIEFKFKTKERDIYTLPVQVVKDIKDSELYKYRKSVNGQVAFYVSAHDDKLDEDSILLHVSDYFEELFNWVDTDTLFEGVRLWVNNNCIKKTLEIALDNGVKHTRYWSLNTPGSDAMFFDGGYKPGAKITPLKEAKIWAKKKGYTHLKVVSFKRNKEDKIYKL